MLEHRPRALLRALVAATAMALAAPSLAAAADQLSLIDKTEPVDPGITVHHQKFLNSTGWYDEQVLTVDLSNSAVKSDLLTAPEVAQGEALSTMANRVGAAAGVNGDFFDTEKPVVTLNAASSGGVPAGSIVAYTSAWGSQIRGRSMAGATNVAVLRPGQPRVLPRRRPGRPRAVHRRVRPALRHVRPQRHAVRPPRLLLRHPAHHQLGADADTAVGAR